ncbi:MAG: DUF2075 domain-containing protein [Flavobacterium sp.]|nr:MAG: DUF2075 domain-containing protein [Flavobacterium sp.]
MITDINGLFNPSSYLISPFNSTESFANGDYFLTLQQDQIKKQVVKHIDAKGKSFTAISGKAGTGKSILTYDIARKYKEDGHKVLVVHSGNLNGGHYMLNNDYGWNIIPAKGVPNTNLNDFFLVVVDETQRIYPKQLKLIIDNATTNATNCIFSYDSHQCLRNQEISNDIATFIKDTASPIEFVLNDKIRTNEEIASFIKCLFDKGRAIHDYERKNVELNYFRKYVDARDYLEVLKANDWKVINYTPSRDALTYNNYNLFGADSVHEVIGQEFDNVVAVIDSSFYYDGGRLSSKQQPYYNITKMLYQIVTRTRRKLNIIIINNDEILERCLDILKK